MKNIIIIILLSFLICGCDVKYIGKDYIVHPVGMQEDEGIEKFNVKRKFSFFDITEARESAQEILNLLNLDWEIDFDHYYWSDDIECCYGMALYDKFIIISEDIKPKYNFQRYDYGVILVHEWAHFRYKMNESEVRLNINEKLIEKLKELEKFNNNNFSLRL